MLSRNGDYKSLEITETVLPVASNLTEAEDALAGVSQATPTKFHVRYSDYMEMSAPAVTVAEYLNSHASWFVRCAEPMKVQPLGENGYALIIGRFCSFGYEVVPKIGLELLPAEEGVYRIRTIPIPDYCSPGYDVDYRAALQLVEKVAAEVTHVEWELDLTVELHFPRFIQRLPKSLIQSTGDRLLNQIVRQVSRRLTRKVQEDFHQSLGIPFCAAKKKR